MGTDSKDTTNVLEQRLDKLLGKFTLAILFGKFLGDLVTRWLVVHLGQPWAVRVGVLIFGVLLVLWPIAETRLETS